MQITSVLILTDFLTGKAVEEKENMIWDFFAPIVLIQLPFILPQMMIESFIDTVKYMFEFVTNGFGFE